MSGALRDVLTLTQFGLVSQVRLALAIVLAICLAFERSALWRRLGLGAAVGLIASIAWTGHAASTPYKLGYLHLTSDALHLTAAAAWIGGLVPLALLLNASRRYRLLAWASLELDVVRRFSILGSVNVATLILSGARQAAHRGLSRNTLIEIALGLSIFAMVGVLGTLHPAAHLVK